MVFASLVLLSVLASIVSAVIRRSVTQPLQTITRHIKTMGQGQFADRLDLTRHDEIGQLANEFDRMAAQLQDAQRRLIMEHEEKLHLGETIFELPWDGLLT
jgi:nitrate/nitrite-specific signal transduction histidine kinase